MNGKIIQGFWFPIYKCIVGDYLQEPKGTIVILQNRYLMTRFDETRNFSDFEKLL